MKKALFTVFSLILIMGMLINPASAQAPVTDERVDGLSTPQVALPTVIEDNSVVEGYIVLLEDASLAGYEGDVAGLRATSPSTTGERKLDVSSAASVAYLDYLHTKQDAFLESARAGLGRSLAFTYRYDVVLNGFAMQLSGAEATRISKMPGVRAVLKDEIRQLDTDTSPEFLGVSTLWDYTANTTPGDIDSLGEGMLIGILDTGINMDHPSFAEVGPVDGYIHENPFGTGVFKGLCASDPSNYICNDKLVGVYAYTTEAVMGEDGHSHGSHTASTSAGNYLDTTYEGIPVSLSGMAPHANIIAYDVCDPNGCANAGSAAAVQQAIIDGVDVLNYSIGPSSGESDPYADPVELAMLDAMAAGILTSTSAGNSGPAASTVYKAPAWDIVVANSSHNRSFGYEIIVSPGGGERAGDVTMTGVVGTGVDFTDTTPQALKWAGDDAGNVEGCVAFPADFFLETVALISRGTCGFAAKVNNAAAAGADGVIVYNNRLGPAIVMGALEATTIPSIMVDQADGEAAVSVLGASTTVSVTDNFVRVLKDEWADIIDSQTSRGPYTTHDVLEPEVAAPGTNILAAYWTAGETGPFGQVDPGDEVEIDLMSGTSMASPHVAGSALLLMDLFPDWTPMEIKSALVMTADNDMIKDNGVDPTVPFDVGNGRVDLTKAALIGLVMDETKANFVAAAPSEGGDVRTLNIPSYQNSQCVGDCSFERTFTSVADVSVEYNAEADLSGVNVTVTPSTFTIDPGASQTVTFDIDVSGDEIGTWQFGSVTFYTVGTFLTGEPISEPRISMAVMPDAGNLPALVEETVYRDAGGVVLEDLYAIEITDLTIEYAGLTEADIYDFELAEDPTNGDAFDDLDDVWWMMFEVPTDTKRLVLEVLETTAPDLDLFFGYTTSPTGVPTEANILAASATGAALEYYSEIDPYAYPYYWVLIQNWTGSAEPLDAVKFALGIVLDTDEDNFEVSGPSAISAGDLFNLDITWDVPAMEPYSAWYGWFSVGSDNPVREPGDIGETELNIYRPYDDVTKTVSVESADPGDVVTYTITIEPNMTGEDLEYDIEDVLPAGVTYVEDSLETTGTLTDATFDEMTNSINWDGTMPNVEYTYIASDNSTNPYCDTPFGGYRDIAAVHGFATSSGLFGDEIYWSYGTLMDGTGYYDQTLDSPFLTDDGYYDMDSASFDMWDYNNYAFPDVTPPNGIFAPFQRDMVIVYDAALNKGVTAVNYGVGWLVEFDDVEDWYNSYSGLGLSMDYEVFAWKELDPSIGWPDIIVAFDNVVGDWGDAWFGGDWGSVGLENFNASVGTTYAYNDYSPASGDIICFDFALNGADPVVITFDVTVEETDVRNIENTVMHDAYGYGMSRESASVTFDVNLALTDLDLYESLNEVDWNIVPGSFADGFGLLMDPLEDYYYLDVDHIVANRDLVDSNYPFYLDQRALPAGFMPFWDAKGVNASADPASWQGIMYQIITGNEPMFYLKVDGMAYDLIDGLQFIASGYTVEETLRVNGDYPIGEYTFIGQVEDVSGLTDDVAVDIEFLAPFDLTDLDLFSSLDLVAWDAVDGTFADGFVLPLDPVNDYYYLDADNLVANRTVGDGLFPFYLDQTDLPAGFMAYWDAKGVNAGASGATWQGIMYQVIIGNEPMFLLKVDGTSYDLIDGLQYLASMGTAEEPLRVSGDYPFGMYTFNGVVEDEFGYGDDVTVDITFNDKPVAYDQSLTTPEDVALAITLTASDGFPGDPFVWFVDQPAHGELTGTAPDLLYTPDMDYYGPDSFTFYVNDGFNNSNTATITIDVTSVEDDPIALDDYYETPMGVTLEVAAPGVMTNDYDGDPTDLMLVILGSGPTHGTVTLYGDGSFIYIPNEGYIGPDSFEYTLLSLPTRAFIDQATVYIDVTAFIYYLPLLIR